MPIGRTSRKLALLLTMVTALLIPALPSAADTTPREAVEALRADVAAAYPEADKALERLDKALAADYWNDAGMPASDKTFKEAKKAAKEIAEWDAGTAAGLATIYRGMVVDSADPKVAEKLAKGDAKLGEGKFKDAIDSYRKAWKRATKPAKGGGAGGDFGDSHRYTFTFVAADSYVGDVGYSDTLIVDGTSGSNEGYLFHPAFGPNDTYLTTAERASVIAAAPAGVLPVGWDPANGGVMQVHVSCSDAFPGGVGAKSDPEPASNWLVAEAYIQKDNKTCNLVMLPIVSGGGGGGG